MTIIRPARESDALAIARVHVEVWRETYPTLLPPDYLVDRLDVERVAANWARSLRRPGGERVLVAVDEAVGVIGFAAYGASREQMFAGDGELYAIYLDIDAQGEGIGRTLCGAVARDLLQDGRKALCVEVLEGNPSRFFYEALGAERAALKQHCFAGEVLPAVLYRWPDLTVLTSAKLPESPRE